LRPADVEKHLLRIVERMEQGEETIIDPAGVPTARVVPVTGRVDRAAVGSLGQVDLSDEWDSLRTNAEIAADFGLEE
jgi:antitoxin (DNA-binding transcriptional repressor) of toxin-antitoxin stability system